MKYILIILIIFIFGFIGFYKKQKIINQKKFIEQLVDYINFYNSNLAVFQVDLKNINDKYIITQNNKSANINKIIIKNCNLYDFNYNLLENMLSNTAEYQMIKTYFNNIGKLSFEFEKEKNNEILDILKKSSSRLNLEIKSKGELMFKVYLAVGAIIAILIW